MSDIPQQAVPLDAMAWKGAAEQFLAERDELRKEVERLVARVKELEVESADHLRSYQEMGENWAELDDKYQGLRHRLREALEKIKQDAGSHTVVKSVDYTSGFGFIYDTACAALAQLEAPK